MDVRQVGAREYPVSHGNAPQASRLTALPPAPETGKEETEEHREPASWVALDALRGLLVCRELGLEVAEFIGVIMDSRLVRVMQEDDTEEAVGIILCASSNRLTSDLGRPGRECGPCEEKGVCCFPHWRIAWREVAVSQDRGRGRMFAHTLSRIGTLNFTRYAARLEREGLSVGRVITRLFAEKGYRHVQFEHAEADQFEGRVAGSPGGDEISRRA